MKRITIFIILFVLPSIGSLLLGQETSVHPAKVEKAVYFDVSPPIRDVQRVLTTTSEDNESEEKEVMNKFGFREIMKLKTTPYVPAEDPVWQKQDGTAATSGLIPIQNFEGINNLSNVYPPDTQGDVSLDKYVQVVNMKFSVYSKSGTLLLGPLNISTIFAGIPAPWNGTNNGDPVVLYDQAADRWLITEFSLPTGIYNQFAELVAVSTTSDPTGSWYRYVFQYGTKMPDYPKFGVWPDGYYMAANLFTYSSGWNYAGQGASVFERAKMLAGDPTAMMLHFEHGVAAADPSGMLPSDWDGTIAPVAGEPNHFTYFDNWSSATNRYLNIWDFHTDWVTPANSTFTQVANLLTATFDASFCGYDGGVCIPQPVTTIKLATLSDRLMYRQQYRNFSSYRAMVTNHTVDVNGSDHAGIRWYELRNTGAGWNIYQQGTYAPDAAHRWMGSMAMNSSGDIALGYSVSDATSIYPSIRVTGRKAGDALGLMTVPEQTIFTGTGYQSGSVGRWGDYSMMSVDPSDDLSFWYTTEYIQTSGSTPWRTRIAAFKFTFPPSVSTNPAYGITTTAATLSGSVNPKSAATNYHFEYGTTISYGFSTPVVSAGSGATSVTVSAGITGLIPGTTYHYRLVAVNSEGTSYGSDITFNTDCNTVYGLPFYEGFATTSIPLCWAQIDHQGYGQIWQFGTITGYSTSNPILTGNYAYLNSDGYGNGNTQNADLVSPKLDLSGFGSVTLSFYHFFRSWSGSSGTLYYSIDNGANWVVLQSFTATTANPELFTQSIPAVAGQSQVRFKWNYTGTWGYYWAFDDVQIYGVPANQQLSNITIPNGFANCYGATQTINVAGSGTTFVVQNGGFATLVAGLKIDMLPGTKVQPGGYLWGHIAPAGPYCASPITLPANPLAKTLADGSDQQATTTGDLFKVYPNPTTGRFTLEINPGGEGNLIADVQLYSVMGSLILKEEVIGMRKTEFSLADKPVGVYLIKVVSGGRTGTAKIIKQ